MTRVTGYQEEKDGKCPSGRASRNEAASGFCLSGCPALASPLALLHSSPVRSSAPIAHPSLLHPTLFFAIYSAQTPSLLSPTIDTLQYTCTPRSMYANVCLHSHIYLYIILIIFNEFQASHCLSNWKCSAKSLLLFVCFFSSPRRFSIEISCLYCVAN